MLNNMTTEEYYNAPSDDIFEDIKQAAIKLWYQVDTDIDCFGYATEKVNRIKDLKNISDNAWYIVAMFDHGNQRLLYSMCQEPARAKIEELWQD